ncbi:MTRF1L release factor glutamine methyltransferase-like isoform X2 [Mercenaria mercenaria]|nr:MTRF1L release factor glutamine methyltransferase-like isoform X2 [Mercenaria mercenaria]XP_053384244.1 MTRF1L release factor glutamine methyltransferase-like isoform X2 [Mercenaria mercenaria]
MLLSKHIQVWKENLSLAGVQFAGEPDADSSVNLIVAHVLGSKMKNVTDMNFIPSECTQRKIEEMCKERMKRKPVQYIIGEWTFHDMTLEMRPPVFIPRRTTEDFASIIVNEWSLEHEQTGRFLEIGCGTGAVSLYILRKLPNVKCVVVDKNEIACKLTVANATRYNLEERIHVIHGDILQDRVISELSRCGPYNVLVSNPPSMSTDKMRSFGPELEYEDLDAIYAGTDGLDIIRRILAISHTLLYDNLSFVWLEMGEPERIKGLLESHHEIRLSYMETFKDFRGRDRCCKLQLNDAQTV